MPDAPPDADDSSPFLLSGINGTTGAYLPAPADLDAVYAAAAGRPNVAAVIDAGHYETLRTRDGRLVNKSLGVAFGIDPKRLDQTGWGAVFPADAPPELREALSPLLDHRKSQMAAARPDFYQEFAGKTRGHQPGDDAARFLKRLKRDHSQPADPKRGVPYYLLLVGSPQLIPWRFQYDLDVNYAVGRLHFEAADGRPDYDAYRRYARSVVAAETAAPARPRSVAFFAPNHDTATAFSAGKLVGPLAADVDEWNTTAKAGWAFATHLRGAATKAQLGKLLGGEETPAVLFTAGHGIGFEKGDARQFAHQGGLVCQDIGPVRGGAPVPTTAYFHAGDVGPAAKLHGLLSFHFACYGAGTPAEDDFPDAEQRVFLNRPLAPHAFAARLPQALLGHPDGGALAFVGHVDRAWACSFLMPGAQEQIDVFSSFLKELLDGAPVGRAMEYFNGRYSALAAALTSRLQEVRNRVIPDEAFKKDVAANWLAHNDARNYVIFGDPAVRVRAAAAELAPG